MGANLVESCVEVEPPPISFSRWTRNIMYFCLCLMMTLWITTSPSTSSPLPQPQPRPLFLSELTNLIRAKLGLKKTIVGAIAR